MVTVYKQEGSFLSEPHNLGPMSSSNGILSEMQSIKNSAGLPLEVTLGCDDRKPYINH